MDSKTTASSGTGGSGGTTTGQGGDVGGSGGGGTGPITCNSNSDCPEPTNVCDTVKNICVECLVLSDCGHKAGTVCDKGKCDCPGTDKWCGPNNCVDTDTSPDNCGDCEHACFGTCAMGKCTDPWEPTATKGAPGARSRHVAIWTGKVMVVWGGTSNGGASGALNTGAMYDPATLTWTALSTVNAPTPRYWSAAVWTGTEMIVWGGIDTQGNYSSDGARFNPTTNAWSPMTDTGAPPSRARHTAVWADNASPPIMIVWGGTDAANELNSGGRYDPSADKWEPTKALPLPAAPRQRHGAVWDTAAQRMIIYGGRGDGQNQSNIYLPGDSVPGGHIYNPQADTWLNTTPTGEPSARADFTATWDGSRMLVFGGTDGSYLDTGFQYLNDGWSPFNGTPPSARHEHTAVWLDGAKRLVVWGGRDGSGVLDSGAVLDSANNTWDATVPTVLDARSEHTAVSTGTTMIVWGGINKSNQRLNTGGVYTP